MEEILTQADVVSLHCPLTPETKDLIDLAALKTMKVDTLVGNLDWNSGPFPNIAKTPLVGAQWRKTDGGQFPYELVIVSNAHAKEQGLDVPLGGKVEPLSGS